MRKVHFSTHGNSPDCNYSANVARRHKLTNDWTLVTCAACQKQNTPEKIAKRAAQAAIIAAATPVQG